MIKVQYKFNILTKNDEIERDGYSVLKLLNQGTSTAVFAGGVEILPGGSFDLYQRPGEIIDNDFIVSFKSGENLINSLVVVKGYYKR